VAISVAGVALAAAAFGASQRSAPAPDDGKALVGEARSNSLTVELGSAVGEVKLTKASAPGRPIVVLDPGHGGRDPGASGISGSISEKSLTLALARELRDTLAKRGRVRVAMTREDDRYLTLDQRAEIARRLGASAYLSLHIDSAPNPEARGATVYSLSDVASDAETARFAERENKAGEGLSSDQDGSVRGMLSDLALREQMNSSATLAERLVRKSAGRYLLRPNPHRFADFVKRSTQQLLLPHVIPDLIDRYRFGVHLIEWFACQASIVPDTLPQRAVSAHLQVAAKAPFARIVDEGRTLQKKTKQHILHDVIYVLRTRAKAAGERGYHRRIALPELVPRDLSRLVA
jgi:N-acetylmuramoyl-L-alanine amidase